MAQLINRRNLNKYKPLGIRNPIRNAAQDGVFDMTSRTIDRVKSSLYTLLFTAPGTRVMMPTFGSPIYALNFEQVSELDFSDIEDNIRQAAATWVPEATINHVKIEQNPQAPNEFTINIGFALVVDPQQTDQIMITAR